MTGPLLDEDWIRPDGKGGVIIGTASPVSAEDLPQIIAWIYEAAGIPNPIALPRVKVSAAGENGPGWHVNLDDGTVTVRAVRLPPDEARTVAAVIASTADLAENEPAPDPAEVERVAAFFDEQMDTDPVTLARRLLGSFEVTERVT
jgi:hypothetical protein